MTDSMIFISSSVNMWSKASGFGTFLNEASEFIVRVLIQPNRQNCTNFVCIQLSKLLHSSRLSDVIHIVSAVVNKYLFIAVFSSMCVYPITLLLPDAYEIVPIPSVEY